MIEIIQHVLGYDKAFEQLVVHIGSPEMTMKLYFVVEN